MLKLIQTKTQMSKLKVPPAGEAGQIFNLKLNKDRFFLIFVLLLGLFFRAYRFSEHYSFDVDHDIYSFIVKDIVVDKHLRLIGQLTSVEGLFVGPLYYYLLVPFYLLFNMDPLAAVTPAILIGLVTLISIYFVFSEFFGKLNGKIGALLYATSMPIAFQDRWVVPTQLIFLWSIWYLYLLLSILKGKNNHILLFALLIALIWHINLGLAPLLLLILPCIYFSTKKPLVNLYIKLVLISIILSLPVILFELKHGFIQTKALLSLKNNQSTSINWISRTSQTIEGSSLMILYPFFEQTNLPSIIPYILLIAIFYYLKRNKFINNNQLVVLILWFLIMIFSQLFSSRPISQYYFNSLIIISLLLFSLILKDFYEKQPEITITLLTLFTALNLYYLISKPANPFGYLVKKGIIEFIKKDSQEHSLPCVGISFITDRGRDVGFRYLFWWKNLRAVYQSQDVPTYQIIIPPDGILTGVDKEFGKIGVNLPKDYKTLNPGYCQNPDSQFDPIWGVTF